MWAVYFCGCTDGFLNALFAWEEDAREFAKKCTTEGTYIVYWPTPADIDTTDTGWQ